MRLTGVIDVPNSFVLHTTTTQQVSIYLNGAHYTTVNPHTALSVNLMRGSSSC
jgi:hypothetical protein